MTEYADVSPKVVARLRKVCLALPDAYEEKAWAGHRWMVRKRTFAQVLGVDEHTVLTFRSEPPELDVLCVAGPPFFKLGWGRDVMGMVLDAKTDWAEVTELLADSYCVMAPKKLRAVVEGVTPHK